MRLTIAAVLLGMVTITAQATPVTDAVHLARQVALIKNAGSSPLTFEVKARKGSTRVGGTNKSGKGSRYVGGRK